ncbi:MAG: hypothetical protein DI538_08355 [Azospira oryzae]|jgi:hypothetical protein|nr:MAG: hypothetical protein DI538_08355 [Azospira oryzae]
MKSKLEIFAQGSGRSWKTAIVSLVILFISAAAFAQSTSQTIRGIVKSAENNQPVPGTNIYLKSQSSVGTFSDSQGQFEFPRPLKAGDVLVFSFIGLKTTEWIISDQTAGYVVIEMAEDPIQMVDEILTEGDETARVAASAKRIRKVKANH